MSDDYSAVEKIAGYLDNGATLLQGFAHYLRKTVEMLKEHQVVGVGAFTGTPTTHSETKGQPMKVCLIKKGAAKASSHKLGATPITQFALQDNGDCSFTVMGMDGAGNTIDISSVATMTVSSDNTAAVTVDAPTGLTSMMHAPTNPAPAIGATANITVVVTWNDPSTAPAGSPFTFKLPVTIQAGPVSGVTIVPGTPTSH